MKDSRLSVLSMVRPERRVSTLERVMEPEAEGEMVRVPEMVSQAEREVASAWERISMGLEPGFFHISYGQIGRYCMRGEIQLGFEAARTDRRDMSPRMSRRIWSILPIEPPPMMGTQFEMGRRTEGVEWACGCTMANECREQEPANTNHQRTKTRVTRVELLYTRYLHGMEKEKKLK